MRVLTVTLACWAAAVILTGCKGETPPQGTAKDKKLTIAVIPKSTGNEFWETVKKGADAAAEKHGVTMRWEGTVTETEIAEQAKIIENMINLEVDGMALAPLNRKVMAKSIRNVVAADIPVLVFDSGVDGDAHFSFVATNNKKGGSLAAEHMVKLLGDKKGRVMVLRFVQGTGSCEDRAEGFIEAAESAGLEVLADPNPDQGSIESSKMTASNTLEKYIQDKKLRVDGIFAVNLIATLGMGAALDDLRKGGIEVTARFIGFDTSPKLIKALQAGKIDALVSQAPKKMGYLAVDTLVKHLRGEKVTEFVDTGVELVTKERLEKEKAIRELVGLE